MNNTFLSLLLCLDYTSTLFFLGFIGLIINRRNLLLVLLSLELTFLSSSLNFIFAGGLLNMSLGYLYGVLVILIVVADTAVGLSLIILTYRNSKQVTMNSFSSLRG